MFSVDANPTFTHTVKVKVPVNGGYEDQTFKVTYNVIPTHEFVQFDLTDGKGSTAFLKRAIAHMDDLADMKGNPLHYSDDLRDRILALPYVRTAVAQTYLSSVAGSYSGN